jgi:hypothetical protein
VISLLAMGAAWAGPWVHPPGTWYAKAGLSHFRGRPDAQELEFHGMSAGVYAEVGLLPGLEGVLDLPYSWGHNRFSGSELRYRAAGPGTARLGFTLTPPAWEAPASLRVLARLPLSGPSGRLPLDPSPGEQQLDLDALLALGGSPPVGQSRAWGLAELGLRYRTPLVLHEAPATLVGHGQAALYHVQLGWLHQWGWLQVEGQGFVDLGGPRHAHGVGVGGALGLGGGLHLEAGAARTFAGSEALGWGWSAGISHIRR